MPEALTLTDAEFERQLVSPDPSGAPVPPVTAPRRAEDVIRTRAARPGVRFDSKTGAPFLTRLNISRAPDPATKQAMLQDAFETSKVVPFSFTENGPTQFVVQDFKDPVTGELKDLLVDETAITAKDLAELGEVGIGIVGALAALRGGGALGLSKMSPGLLKLGAESLVANTGAAVANTISEVQAVAGTAQKTLSDAPLADIAAQQGLAAGLGTVADLGVGVPVLGFTKLLNLRRGVPSTPEAKAGQSAAARLQQTTGQRLDFTLGEQTGSQGLRESEAFLENVTLGGGPLRRFGRRRERQLTATEEAIVGSGPLPDKDTLGAEAVRSLRGIAEDMDKLTLQARSNALNESMGLLSNALDSSTGLGTREILTREAGTALQMAEQTKKDAFDEISNQLAADVTQSAGTDVLIPSKLIIEPVKDFRQTLTKPGTEELYRFVPANVRAFLDDIKELPEEIALKDIRGLRTAVNEAISQSEILGTAETASLKQISSRLTEGLENSVAYIDQIKGNPNASAALSRFNKFYRENIKSFQIKGVTELLADPTQRKLGPAALFRQAATDTDQYFRVKNSLTSDLILDGETVGPFHATDPFPWRIFKQAVLNEFLDSARIPGSGRLISADKFLSALNSLDKEVKRDLLGEGSHTVEQALSRLSHLQNPKINASEALEALRRGGDAGTTAMVQLVNREEEIAKLYQNQIVKRFVKGEIGSESIQPGQFIDRYIDVAPEGELRDVMIRLDAVDPILADTIRRKTVSNLFVNARKEPFGDVTSAKKLAQEIGAEETQKRLKAVIGPQKLQNLNDFLSVLQMVQGKSGLGSAKTAGAMSRGSTQQAFLLLQLAKWPKQAWRYFIGAVFTNPTLHRMLTGPVQPLDPSKTLRSIILSDDFVFGAVQEFGRDAGMILKNMEQALNETAPPPTMTDEEFNNRLR